MTEVQLLVWLFGIHIVGFVLVGALLVPALRHRDQPDDGDSTGGSDDGWGNLPTSPAAPKGMPGGGLPLPDAEQSPIRFREPGRLADRIPARQRRPVRTPARPQRVPHR
jgi:hypothetical protein